MVLHLTACSAISLCTGADGSATLHAVISFIAKNLSGCWLKILCYQICIHSKPGGELLHPNPASCVPYTKKVNLSSSCGEKRTAMGKIFIKFSSEVLGTYHQFLAKPVPGTDGKMFLHQYWYFCCAKNMSQQLVLPIEYGK